MKLQPGQPLWWHDPEYISGYQREPTRAIFVMRCRARNKINKLGIAVELADGRWLPRWASGTHIELRTEEEN